MNHNRILAAMATLLFVGCATPRVTTEEERALANSLLTTIETVGVAAFAAGKMDLAKFEALKADILQLRVEVADSAETPVGWDAVYQRVLNLAVEWSVRTQ